MRLTDSLRRDQITVSLKADSKEGVIRELSDFMLAGHPEDRKEDVVQALLDREKLGSTGIGNGVAIPHARTDLGDDVRAAVGLTSSPVDFGSLDGKPVRLVFMILCPKDKPGLHIRFLARASRLLNDSILRDKLLACTSADQVYEAIDEYENEHFH